jgi:hypothetical protein
MRRIIFSESNRSGNLLHIEVPGGIVNIRVNLHDHDGRQVTSVEILRDQYAEHGGTWGLDGYANSRLIQLRDGESVSEDGTVQASQASQAAG